MCDCPIITITVILAAECVGFTKDQACQNLCYVSGLSNLLYHVVIMTKLDYCRVPSSRQSHPTESNYIFYAMI